MRPRVVAAVLAGGAGVLLALAGALPLLADGSREWHGVLADAGYALAVVALCAMGYGLVARAPVWLRIVVSVAYPLLVASVWQVVDQAIEDRVDGWKGPAGVHLLAGAILLVAALLAVLGRRRPRTYDDSDRGSTDDR